MASTSQDMDNLQKKGKLYKFMNGPLTLVMKAVFAAVYRRSDTKDGTLTLKDCLKHWKENKVPIFQGRRDKLMSKKKKSEGRREVKDFFHSSVAKKVAEVDILKKNLDIDFYHKAITEFCHIVHEKSLSKETRNLLIEVKIERNNLSHNNLSLTKSLEDYFDQYENLCKQLMYNVGKDLGDKHFHKVRPRVEALIKKVKKEKIDINQREKEERKFFENVEAKFIKDSQKVLQTEREFGTSNDPFVKLVKKKKENKRKTVSMKQKRLSPESDYRISDVFVSPVLFSGGAKVNHKDILTTLDGEGNKPRAVIVCGQGGCGKSTLCHIVLEQWQNKGSQAPIIENLNSVDLIIYVEMKLTTCKTLLEFLRNQYLVVPMRDMSDEEAIKLLDSLRVLFVVDGYDEQRGQGDSFVRDLSSSLPKSRFILTTRSESKVKCKRNFQSRVTWELQGFERSERNKFAKNIFKLVEKDEKIMSTKLKKFKAYLETRVLCLEAHLKLPLTLALLSFLWLENYNNLEVMNRIRTASQHFFQLFKMLREKLLVVRINLKTGGHASTDDVDDVICHLHEKAFNQLKEDMQLVLTDKNQKSIEDMCKIEKINPTEILSAFLASDSIDHAGEESQESKLMVVYSFFHRSQMEYYSARAISHDLSTSSTSLSDYFNLQEKQKYRETLIFLAGCLKQDQLLTKHCTSLVKLCRAVVDEDDFNYWFSLFNVCEMYDETMKKEIGSCLSKSWTLEVKTLVSGLNLLAFCPCIQIEEFRLSFPSQDDLKNMSGVVPSLERLKHARGTLSQEHKTNLYLNAGDHSLDSVNYLSDPLEYFGSWCTVVDFSGRIKEGSVERLLHCAHADVRVRNLDTFNKLAEQSSSMKKLKRLTISVTILRDEVVTAIPQQICNKTATIILNFPKLIDNNVEKTIQFINDARHRSQSFSRVTISGSLEYEDGVKVVEGLQGVVTKEVTINSSQDLTDEQKKTLMTSVLQAGNRRISTFACTWNSDQL